tara:strand:- start:1048 stop:2469 length:1422 start_codon:yes stop_codon:yes gene_type:complete
MGICFGSFFSFGNPLLKLSEDLPSSNSDEQLEVSKDMIRGFQDYSFQFNLFDHPLVARPAVVDIELEKILLVHRLVDRAAVVNIEYDSNVIKHVAFVILKEGVCASPDLGDKLKEFVAKQMCSKEMLNAVVFKTNFQTTIEGRTNRGILKQEALAQFDHLLVSRPDVVEKMLLGHRLVARAAVVNIEYDSNVIKHVAFVILKEGVCAAPVLGDNLKEFVAKQMFSKEMCSKEMLNAVVFKTNFPITIEGHTNIELLKQEALEQLDYSKDTFRDFLEYSSKCLIRDYIYEWLPSDLVTELLGDLNSGTDETISTSNKIGPFFEKILSKERVLLIKREAMLINEADLNPDDIHWFVTHIKNYLFDNFNDFATLLNDSFYKLRKGFFEEFNAVCNETLSPSLKFSKDEVASFSLFMILEVLWDDFFCGWDDTKLAIESKVTVRYHSRLAEFKGCVIDYSIQTPLLAGGIMKPLNNN